MKFPPSGKVKNFLANSLLCYALPSLLASFTLTGFGTVLGAEPEFHPWLKRRADTDVVFTVKSSESSGPRVDFYVDSKACAQHLKTFDESIRRYMNYFALNRPEAAENWAKIERLLVSADVGQLPVSESCIGFTRQLYPLYAVNHGYNDFGDMISDVRAVFSRTALMLLKHDKIRVLDENFRRELGPDWLEPSPQNVPWSGKYKLFSAYACHDSSIYVDVSIRPYDIGGYFIHELQHVYFDKLTYWDDGSAFSADRYRGTLNLEEALAIFTSSFTQFLEKNPREKKGWHYIENWKEKWEKHPFKGTDDLTFFTDDGVLRTLLNKSLGLYREKAMFPDLLLLNRFYEEAANASLDVTQPKKFPALAALHKLFEMVDLEYFRDAPFGPQGLNEQGFQDFRARLIERPWEAFPMLMAGAGEDLDKKSLELLSEVIPSKELYNLVRSPRSRQFAMTGRTASFEARLNEPSEGCKTFIQNLQNGTIRFYRGAGGIEELLKEDDALKPALNEETSGYDYKPGGHGVKPGGHGVKPGGHGVKPCLHPLESGNY